MSGFDGQNNFILDIVRAPLLHISKGTSVQVAVQNGGHDVMTLLTSCEFFSEGSPDPPATVCEI